MGYVAKGKEATRDFLNDRFLEIYHETLMKHGTTIRQLSLKADSHLARKQLLKKKFESKK